MRGHCVKRCRSVPSSVAPAARQHIREKRFGYFSVTALALGFGGSSGPFFPQAETPNPATSAATTNTRTII
jgi:hypothetical protein